MRRGEVRSGKAMRGLVRLGAARALSEHGGGYCESSGPGEAWQGRARQGRAR